MPSNTVITKGEIRPDGSLDIHEPLSLPPGEVEVAVTPIPSAVPGSVWDRLDAIWQSQRARGHHPRSTGEIESEIESLRGEWDQ